MSNTQDEIEQKRKLLDLLIKSEMEGQNVKDWDYYQFSEAVDRISFSLECLGYQTLSHSEQLYTYSSIGGMEALEDHILDELSDEFWHASFLIKNEQINKDIFNTFSYVRKTLEQLRDPLTLPYFAGPDVMCDSDNLLNLPNLLYENLVDDDWRGFETLKKLGRQLNENRGSHEDYSQFYQVEHHLYPTPIELFVACIRVGDIPPAELLISVAKAFDLYFQNQGELTLEDVFFGDIPKRRGNYASRRAKNFKGISLKEFHHSVVRGEHESLPQSTLRGEPEKLERLAQLFIKGMLNEDEVDRSLCLEDAEALVKAYRRWKKWQSQIGKPDT